MEQSNEPRPFRRKINFSCVIFKASSLLGAFLLGQTPIFGMPLTS